jgi:hypothetical protein
LLDRLLDFEGLRLPSAEQKELGQIVRDYINKHKLWDAGTEENHYNLLDIPLHDFRAAQMSQMY